MYSAKTNKIQMQETLLMSNFNVQGDLTTLRRIASLKSSVSTFTEPRSNRSAQFDLVWLTEILEVIEKHGMCYLPMNCAVANPSNLCHDA